VTAATNEVSKTIEKAIKKDLPLAPAKKAYKGATAMGRPSTGYVYPAVTGAGAAGANDLFLGYFAETVDNSANTATTLSVTVDFVREKTLLWRAQDGTLAATDRFNSVYAADDQTVSKTSTNAPPLGKMIDIDAVLGVCFEVEGL
jgi:hypothetical protein